jgi:hypothetical protein
MGGALMKRDMELIRALLLRLEKLPLSPGAMTILDGDREELAIEGYTSNQISYHLDQLKQAGFVYGPEARLMSGITFCGLTWEGHDFLDSVRDPETWKKTKEGVLSAGGFTVELLKDLAKGFVKKKLEDTTGVKL